MAGLEASGELEHLPRRPVELRGVQVAGGDAEHLIVEPRVDHGFPETPLISDFDARKRPVRHELQHRSLVEAQVRGELFDRHEAVVHAASSSSAFLDRFLTPEYFYVEIRFPSEDDVLFRRTAFDRSIYDRAI